MVLISRIEKIIGRYGHLGETLHGHAHRLVGRVGKEEVTILAVGYVEHRDRGKFHGCLMSGEDVCWAAKDPHADVIATLAEEEDLSEIEWTVEFPDAFCVCLKVSIEGGEIGPAPARENHDTFGAGDQAQIDIMPDPLADHG